MIKSLPYKVNSEWELKIGFEIRKKGKHTKAEKFAKKIKEIYKKIKATSKKLQKKMKKELPVSMKIYLVVNISKIVIY